MTACHRDSSLETSLTQAGANRAELETLLRHYTEDPEKQWAARFLVENMNAHYTLESDASKTFRTDVEKLFSQKGRESDFYHAAYDSIFKTYQASEKELSVEWDTKKLTADFLIAHIDSAFKIWREDPWVEKYSLEHFCNYVLPYRIGHEPTSHWHERFRKISLNAVKGYSNVQENRHHKYGIYSKVKGDMKPSLYFPNGHLPELPLTAVADTKVGNCEAYTAYCVTLLRAFGLPAVVDFTPQWGNRSMGHSWAVYLPEKGEALPFTLDEPIGHHFFRRQTEFLPKVFRRTFARQPEMGELHRRCEGVMPKLFRTMCLRDVTDEYITTSDIDVPLFSGVEDEVVYIAVFNNQEWSIVHHGKRSGRSARFEKMGRNIVYLPMSYGNNGESVPAGHPFALRDDGSMQVLQADTARTCEVNLYRKYKPSNTLETWASRLAEVELQVAASADFSDARTVAQMGKRVEGRFNRMETDYEGDFRYLRLVSKRSWCEVAEMEIYGKGGEKITPLRLSASNAKDTLRCFDGNPLTFNSNKTASTSWIGMEFQTDVHVDSVRILPRNDDNFIREGEKYRLLYWSGTGWRTIKELTGNREGVFRVGGVPQNALLLLRNLTKGREERIFTCEDGEQVWW